MDPKIIKLYKIMWKKFFVCCLTILVSLVTPFLFLSILPIFIVRIFVSRLSKIIRPDLGKMLSSLSCVFACDDYTKNPKWTNLGLQHMKGSPDINIIKMKIENIIGVQKVGNDLKNIELKQYPYKWMGFTFWKWDENFDISNHVRFYGNRAKKGESKISRERLNEINHELLFQSYPEKRSPWDVTIILNIQADDKGEESCVTYRFHHSIGDGYSLLKSIFYQLMDGEPKQFIPRMVFPKPGIFQMISNFLKLVKLPYDMADCIVESFGTNDWKITERERSKNYCEVFAPKISMAFIKDLVKEMNTSVNAVILAAITAGFRQSMLKHRGKVPHHIHVGLPFPRQGHPDKMRNFVSGIFVKLPVGEEDPLRRLRKIQRSLEKLKTSTIPYISSIVSTCVGSMFHWMIRPVATMTMFAPMTAMGSILPGPKEKITMFGQENVNLHFAIGPHFGNFGITFNTASYRNHMNMRFLVNENILSKKVDVEEMVSIILQELQVLKTCSNEIV